MYKTISLQKNKVYSIFMNDWDEEITGVFVDEGKYWILLQDNQNDFLLDGLRFLNKQNIDEILREEDEQFKEKIFKLKYPREVGNWGYDLENTISLLEQIKTENKLFHFDTDDEEEIFVGRIVEVFEKSFKLQTLTSKGCWGDFFTSEFSEISSIAINNDYLNSLNLLLSEKEK